MKTFGGDDDGGANALSSEDICLIPGIDMASHSFTPSCEIVYRNGCYDLITTRAVSTDEELTISYGCLSNDELFSDYGFTVDNNPYDCKQISLDSSLINVARCAIGLQE